MEPKISVIIPLYNAEKYIRECLLSVLASKFQDYEVLVVDDCSTDNSVAEVKKLLPYFDGRLKILSTEKNSGGPGIPRNVGIKNASGKYVTFVDNDDMILPEALGIFFSAAEAYNADVIHTEKCLVFNKIFNAQNLKLDSMGTARFVDKPALEPFDINYRMQHLMTKNFTWMPWGKVFRRDFLIENRIDFPQMQFGEDFILFVKCLCLAQRYILVPYITNIHRLGIISASVSRRPETHTCVRLFLKVLCSKVSVLDKFMSGLNFFKENPGLQRDVLKFCIDDHFKIIKILSEPHEIQQIFFEELQNPELELSVKNLVAAYFYTERVLRN